MIIEVFCRPTWWDLSQCLYGTTTKHLSDNIINYYYSDILLTLCVCVIGTCTGLSVHILMLTMKGQYRPCLWWETKTVKMSCSCHQIYGSVCIAPAIVYRQNNHHNLYYFILYSCPHYTVVFTTGSPNLGKSRTMVAWHGHPVVLFSSTEETPFLFTLRCRQQRLNLDVPWHWVLIL